LHRTSEDRVDDVAVSQNELQAFAKLGGLIVELLLVVKPSAGVRQMSIDLTALMKSSRKSKVLNLEYQTNLGKCFRMMIWSAGSGKAACGNCPKILPSMEL
jgi:hypothetical protein